jgi:hypothetical protein
MAGEVEGIASLVTALAGSVSKFQSAAELGGAAGDLSDLGVTEAEDILASASAISRALTQRAAAAMRDVATLNAVTASNIRTLERQDDTTAGGIAAAYAGSGVEQIGSPMLTQLTASIEVGRAIGTQNLRRKYGEERLQFEAEQALARAADTRTQAQREAESTLRLRDAQATALRRRQLRTILSGIEPLTNPATVKTISSLFDKPVKAPATDYSFYRGAEYPL